MIKDILVHVTPGEALPAQVPVALDLARRFEARVHAVYPLVHFRLPGYVVGDVNAELLERVRERERERARQIEERVREAVGALELQWTCRAGEPEALVNEAARSADLVVIEQPTAGSSDDTGTFANEVIMGSGRPVLLAPAAGVPPGVGEHVLVAWNGSRECARATHESLALLRRAEKVHLLAMDEGAVSGEHRLEDILAHLARHGIEAQMRRAAVRDHAGDTLLDTVAECGADLLVMGAWGHSRLREVVLGGVTAHVLRHATVPVLVAH